MLTNLVLLTGLAVVLAVAAAAFVALRREGRTRARLAEAQAAGLDQPASLHPVIDPEVCIGSAACVTACPETVLGRLEGVTRMVEPGSCLGHGRCHASCPVEAISLVFGTAERGVDIPLLRAGYESNVDGVFIVGELGGMGLIRNAMRQGMKAVAAIPPALARAGVARGEDPELKDVIIVGGGPAGVATALQCAASGLSYTLMEQLTLGGAVTKYPRRKLVFTEPIQLPLVGRFGKREMLKEELVAEFERVLLAAGVTLLEGRRMVGVDGQVGDFRVRVEVEGGAREVHRGRAVVLAIGRRGTPRRLGVPGEDLPHVVYRMIDPEQYRRRRVLCVGGGDSAIEAAVALAGIAGCEVHLAYRGEAFFRLKRQNRADLDRAAEEGRVTVHLRSEVERITPEAVTLRSGDGRVRLGIDDVIVNAGGILPTAVLESMGVVVETKHGEVAVAPRRVSARASRRHERRTSRRSPLRDSDPPRDDPGCGAARAGDDAEPAERPPDGS